MAIGKILTITEVAERLGMHPVTVYRLVKEARLPVFRIGKMLRFDADQLEKLALVGKLPKRRRRKEGIQIGANGKGSARTNRA
jgi:excisionase family DNA binding protein